MDMRTPFGKVRGRGSARSGTQHFWQQRVTAAANVPLILVFIFVLIGLYGADHATTVAVIGSPLIAVLMILMVVASVWHMRLGMQVIIEDYLHHEGAKIAALIVNTFFAAFIAAASIFAILKMSIGG